MSETDPIADPSQATEPGPATWASWEAQHTLLFRKIAWWLLAFGFFWRIFRYLMAMPIWGDEAMLLVNYFTRDYGDVFGPIEYCQIAPLIFHWAEMAMFQNFGLSEWSVRFPPLLGSVLGLALFSLLARVSLSPLPRTIAIGVLAVAIWPATTGSLVKPYSWDLLFSVVLLIPFALWRNQRERRWPLIVLTIIAPLAMASSYTAVFVAGAIGLAMAPSIYRRRDWIQFALLVLYTLSVCGSFLAHYQYVGKVHLSSKTYGISTEVGMSQYWQGAFPPSNPLELLAWIPLTLAGEIAAYPAGGQRGASILSAVICIFGALAFRKNRQYEWLTLFGVMLALWFIAAALHKYPMGSCRLGQHAAPLFCLFMGAGSAELLRRYVPVRKARFAVIAIAILLGLIGLGGLGRDLFRPYRDLDALKSRQAVLALAEASPEPILIAQNPGEIGVASTHWYLGTLGERVQWVGRKNWNTAVHGNDSLWVIVCTHPTTEDEESRFRHELMETGGQWTCTKRFQQSVSGKGPPEEQTLRGYLFVRN